MARAREMALHERLSLDLFEFVRRSCCGLCCRNFLDSVDETALQYKCTAV